MKHKVSELEGPELHAAVAKANGWRVWPEFGLHAGLPVWLTNDKHAPTQALFEPSTNWDQGGRIIERERISVVATAGINGQEPLQWVAFNGAFDHYIDEQLPGYGNQQGPTPLVAAMRAYVASKLGEEVELP
jgi:hypothetical protein